MSRPGNPRILVARGLDSWLVGWLAVIVWIGVVIADRAGLTLGPNLTTTVYWTGAIITAAHFGLSYHLAYSEGAAALRRRPFALVVGPALLAGTLVVLVAVALAEGASSVARVTSALTQA